MKTIFEGKVNGVVYTNVNDYNAAITEAIASGQSVIASTRTTTKSSDDNECKCKCGDKCCGDKECECQKEHYVSTDPNLFYGFVDEESGEYYLDMLVGTEQDGGTIQQWKQNLGKKFTSVSEMIKDFSKRDLNNYLQDLSHTKEKLAKEHNTIVGIFEHRKNNQDKLNEEYDQLISQGAKIREDINREETNMKLLNSCAILNDEMAYYYDKVYQMVKNRINEISRKPYDVSGSICTTTLDTTAGGDITTAQDIRNVRSITQDEIKRLLESLTSRE